MSRKQGGVRAVGIYVQQGLQYKLMTNLSSYYSNCENNYVEIDNPRCKNVIASCIYKTPNNDIEDCSKLIESCASFEGIKNKLCYIFGDFNIDLLKYQKFCRRHIQPGIFPSHYAAK